MTGKKNNVTVSGMSPVTRDSEGTVVGFPDVCNAPTPSGQVPIPFPNIAKSADLKNGSKSVTINGAPVGLPNSELSRSTGDEAGTGGGLMSGQHGGPAHPVNHDFSVSIEGKGVVRNLDLFTLNARNTAPFPIMQAQEAPSVAARVAEPEEQAPPVEPCPYCGKPKHDFARASVGNNLGASVILRSRILQEKEASTHPWYAGVFSLAAHHLICSEAMDSEDWATWCRLFGYDVNCRENGVMLPMQMRLACQLHAPLHRGDHSAGFAYDVHLPYPNAVKRKLKDIADRIEAGAFCGNSGSLVQELNMLSAEILGKIDGWVWTITRDGRDYQPGGDGCAGSKQLADKRSLLCPSHRNHGIRHAVTGAPLVPGVRPLKAGE